MARANAKGHDGNCGCPACLKVAETNSTDSLLSRASDYPHGPNCNCAGCTTVTRRNGWDGD